MTWFRVDDNLAFHPKVLSAGNAAMGLWVRAGSWASQQLTDGHIPDAIVASLGTKAAARQLEHAGLWDRVDGGWQFHDWHERQPTREHVEGERERSRFMTPALRRSIVERDGLICALCGAPVERSDVHIDHAVPRSKGGPDAVENLQVAHSRCNLKKGARL